MSKMKVTRRDKRMRAGLKGSELNMPQTVIKGIVHPKFNFCHYLLTHTNVLIYFLCWTQKKIFWRIWVTKQSLIHINYTVKKVEKVKKKPVYFCHIAHP